MTLKIQLNLLIIILGLIIYGCSKEEALPSDEYSGWIKMRIIPDWPGDKWADNLNLLNLFEYEYEEKIESYGKRDFGSLLEYKVKYSIIGNTGNLYVKTVFHPEDKVIERKIKIYKLHENETGADGLYIVKKDGIYCGEKVNLRLENCEYRDTTEIITDIFESTETEIFEGITKEAYKDYLIISKGESSFSIERDISDAIRVKQLTPFNYLDLELQKEQ